MLGRSNINQNATSSSGQINQAGRDNNVNNYSFNFSISDIENITFYEDEIKDVIIFFNKCKDDISPPMYTDLKSIDIEDKNRYIVEMHFEDWNYYEIELTDEDVVDEIVENLLNNLVLERFMNKQNPEINWKNVRYFEKEERERSKN